MHIKTGWLACVVTWVYVSMYVRACVRVHMYECAGPKRAHG